MAEAKKEAEHKPKPKKGKLREMHIRRAASGGYIAKHPNAAGSLNHDGLEQDGSPLQHVLPNMEALHDHIEQHMGEPEQGEEQE